MHRYQQSVQKDVFSDLPLSLKCIGKTFLLLLNAHNFYAIPERLRGMFTTRRYTNTRLPYLYLHIQMDGSTRCMLYLNS